MSDTYVVVHDADSMIGRGDRYGIMWQKTIVTTHDHTQPYAKDPYLNLSAPPLSHSVSPSPLSLPYRDSPPHLVHHTEFLVTETMYYDDKCRFLELPENYKTVFAFSDEVSDKGFRDQKQLPSRCSMLTMSASFMWGPNSVRITFCGEFHKYLNLTKSVPQVELQHWDLPPWEKALVLYTRWPGSWPG